MRVTIPGEIVEKLIEWLQTEKGKKIPMKDLKKVIPYLLAKYLEENS